MKIIIDIEEEIYKECIPYKDTPIMSNLANDNSEIVHAVANGTPLPKGHGRLIDADKLLGSDGIIVDSRKCHYIPMIDVYQAPTIIEADKAESEDNA